MRAERMRFGAGRMWISAKSGPGFFTWDICCCWTPWTGGPLQFVNYVGGKEFLARADELTAKYGKRFEPPQAMREFLAGGGRYE